MSVLRQFLFLLIEGDSSTLGWSSSYTWGNPSYNWHPNFDSTPCTALQDWNGQKGPDGNSSTGPLLTNKTYGIVCEGPGGLSNVSEAAVIVDNAVAAGISADPASVMIGETTTIDWWSVNASSCLGSDGDATWPGAKTTNGDDVHGPLYVDTVFTITCPGIAGGEAIASTTVQVLALAPQVDLVATPVELDAGETTLLTWTSNDFVESCEATDGPWTSLGSRAVDNTLGEASQVLATEGSYEFEITCLGFEGDPVVGTVVVQVTDIVTPPPVVELYATPASVSGGGTTTLTWESVYADSCEATAGPWSGGLGARSANNMSPGESSLSINGPVTFRIECTGPGGTDVDVVDVKGTTVELTVSQTEVNQNSTVLLSWSSTNADSCEAISGPWAQLGPLPANNTSGLESGNITAVPEDPVVTFVIRCDGPAGASDTDDADVIVNTFALGVDLLVDGGEGYVSEYADHSPLLDVDLKATVANSDGSPLTYKFYCDVSDASPIITDTDVTEITMEHLDACDYEAIGRYNAKVVVTQGSRPPVEDTVSINTLGSCVLPQASVPQASDSLLAEVEDPADEYVVIDLGANDQDLAIIEIPTQFLRRLFN